MVLAILTMVLNWALKRIEHRIFLALRVLSPKLGKSAYKYSQAAHFAWSKSSKTLNAGSVGGLIPTSPSSFLLCCIVKKEEGERKRWTCSVVFTTSPTDPVSCVLLLLFHPKIIA